jgi:3-deoxy-manno-octulosonate cytidylyltransferase (CMP-KDO synthetase)
MDAFSLGVNQIEDFVLRTDHLPLEGVYFADSYGNLTPDVYERYHQAVSMSKHPKGFHGHDNLGLAFANALHLVNNKGYTYVDATVAGMGRGSGNTKTEQILVWAFAGHLADRFVRVLDKIEALKLKHGWGHSPEYMIAGLKRVHPAYVQKTNRLNLPRSKRLSTIFHLDGTIKYDEQMLPPTKAGVIIPAREASSRFHNKPMALIKGKAMILWVCEAAARAVGESNVVVATDSVKIADAVREAGFEAVTTSPNCLTGTDRVAEAAEKLPFDIVVNVQGDEPLIQPEDILRVIKTKEENPDYIINCFSKILPEEDALSTKIPKVVLTEDNELLYMSRGNVPCDKDGTPAAYKQVCIYGFNREDLALYHSSQKTRAESVEDIEILRFLEKGRRVKMIETFNKGVAVDFPEDVAKVERILNEV